MPFSWYTAMNIACINTADRGGGTESLSVDLNKQFHNLGNQSILLVGRKEGCDKEILEIPTISSHIFPKTIARFFPKTVQSLNRLSTIPNKLERMMGFEEFFHPVSNHILELIPFKPDILVFHNLHGKYFDLRILKRLSRKIPCVLILHDRWLLSGHCAHPKGCLRWKTGCGHCPDLSIYPSIKRDATAFNWKRKQYIFDRSILYLAAPSKWQIERAKESMLSGRKYKVIPNAIDIDIFKLGNRYDARERLNLPKESQIILFTAHSEFKDFDTMIDAARITLQNSQDNENLLTICLGRKGNEQLSQNGSILFPGFIRNPEQLADYYRAADIYLHAAHDETFGKSITEAMACGIPVIATETGGIPEQIVSGINGFLVPPGNSSAMSHIILRLLADPDTRSRIGTNAHESALKYTFTNQATSFIEWFKDVIDDWNSLNRSRNKHKHVSHE